MYVIIVIYARVCMNEQDSFSFYCCGSGVDILPATFVKLSLLACIKFKLQNFLPAVYCQPSLTGFWGFGVLGFRV